MAGELSWYARLDNEGMVEPRDTTELPSDPPRASVIVPTYNRCSTLESVLGALSGQTIGAICFEVIVVADGCTDDTAAMCRQLRPRLPYLLRVIEQENAGPAAARNRGIHEARADLIIFVDDDVVPDARLIEAHLAAHARDDADDIVAIGPLLPPPDMRLNAWGAWEERALCGHYMDMQAGRWRPTYRQFYTGNASLRKRHIVEAGGFNASFSRAEDIELGLRLRELGCRFVFLPAARAWHYVRRDFASWAHMPVAYGHAAIAMGRGTDAREVTRLGQEYYQRNLPTRIAARLCLGSPQRVGLATHLLHALATASWAVHLSPLAYISCGVLYNLRYYEGMASELGGRRIFWIWIRAARHGRDTPDRHIAFLTLTEHLLGQSTGERREPIEVGARA